MRFLSALKIWKNKLLGNADGSSDSAVHGAEALTGESVDLPEETQTALSGVEKEPVIPPSNGDYYDANNWHMVPNKGLVMSLEGMSYQKRFFLEAALENASIRGNVQYDNAQVVIPTAMIQRFEMNFLRPSVLPSEPHPEHLAHLWKTVDVSDEHKKGYQYNLAMLTDEQKKNFLQWAKLENIRGEVSQSEDKSSY